MQYLLLILLLLVGCETPTETEDMTSTEEQDVYGCTDDTACNFNPGANIDSECEYMGCYCSCNFDVDGNNDNICDSEQEVPYIILWEVFDGLDNDDDWNEWAEIAGWNDDKNADGNLIDIGEWGAICMLENNTDGDYQFFHPYEFMQFNENFYYWYPNNFPPFNDCVYTSIEVVGVDEISGITVPFNPPVDYTSISFSRHENTLNISWNPVEYYAPPVFFDEVGNLILVESDSLEYEIYYNSKFDFKTCELEEFFIESDKINTKNSEISIELSNLDSEKCFYLNSKNGYSNLMPDYLVESNFIRCGCGESIELWQRCYDIQQAIFIDLMGSWISGIIPAEIGSLENLITLLLSGNELSGSIPVEIGNLKNLTSLRLNHNQLTGEIPAAIGELTNLNYLDLTYNQLTGEIPQEVCDLIESNNLPISTILEGNDDLINTCDD